MQYAGSKYRLKNEIIPIITKNLTPDRCYVEPFAGGLNIIRHIKHSKKIANDNNNCLISMWKALQKGWLPKEYYAKDEYEDIRKDYQTKGNKYPDYIKGFCGYTCSYQSLFFRGFSDNGLRRDFQKLAMYRCINGVSFNKEKCNKPFKLDNIKFENLDYSKLNIPEDSVVFCDAPYKGVTTDGYSDSRKFDYEKYYNWVRAISKNNEVYISELWMPDDFEVVWEKAHTYQLNKKNRSNKIEKIYKLKQAEKEKSIHEFTIYLILYLLFLLENSKIKKEILCTMIFSMFYFQNGVEYCSNSPPKTPKYMKMVL